MIRAIIFDVDGVISHPDLSIFIKAREEIVRFLSSYNIKITVGSPFFKKVYDALQNRFKDPKRVWEIYLKASNIATKHELMALKNAIIEENVGETISELREKGYLVAICSLSGRRYVSEIINKLRLSNKISAIVTREDVKPKPYPDGIFKICNDLDIEPEECVYIGDHYIDIETARNAGSNIIMFTKNKNKGNLDRIKNISFTTELNIKSILNCISKLSDDL